MPELPQPSPDKPPITFSDQDWLIAKTMVDKQGKAFYHLAEKIVDAPVDRPLRFTGHEIRVLKALVCLASIGRLEMEKDTQQAKLSHNYPRLSPPMPMFHLVVPPPPKNPPT